MTEVDPFRKLKFYTYDEVVIHNKQDDFWVVIHRNVFDLTPFIEDRKYSWNVNMDYLLAFGGKDLSCYFFENGCPKTKIHPKSGIPVPLFPPILEIPQSDRLRGLIKANKRKTIFYGVGCPTKIPEKPEVETKLVTSGYWSQEPLFHIGQITRKERPLRIINTLTGTTRMMKVCDEDSINTIKAKYTEKYNFHAGSYIWRKDYKNGNVSGRLDFNNTLTENGIFAEKDGISPPPALWLFYADDFTVA